MKKKRQIDEYNKNNPNKKQKKYIAPLPIPEEDKPFDIPSSWKWVRLKDIGEFINGYTPKNNINSLKGIPYYKVSDMNTLGNEKYMCISINYIDDNNVKTFPKNTIIYPKNGGAIFTNKKRILTEESVIDLNTGGFIPYDIVNIEYLYNFFIKLELGIFTKGSALPTLDMDKIRDLLFPLPPLSEQRRIVEKLEELFVEIDKLK